LGAAGGAVADGYASGPSPCRRRFKGHADRATGSGREGRPASAESAKNIVTADRDAADRQGAAAAVGESRDLRRARRPYRLIGEGQGRRREAHG